MGQFEHAGKTNEPQRDTKYHEGLCFEVSLCTFVPLVVKFFKLTHDL
jgi:hypothetical protein